MWYKRWLSGWSPGDEREEGSRDKGESYLQDRWRRLEVSPASLMDCDLRCPQRKGGKPPSPVPLVIVFNPVF